MYLLTFFTLIFLNACKDDDCVAGDLDATIVGEWKVTILGIAAGDIEFQSDGTLVDADEAIINNEIGGQPVTEKTYTVNSNSSITVTAANSTGSVSTDLDVHSYTCDEIDMDILGLNATLKRK
jgi:hypothetical protein